MIKIKVYARLNPTEDEEKVINAIKNIFPTLKVEKRGDVIVGEGEGEEALSRFIHIIGREEVAARTLNLLKSRRRGNRITFPLDREVALVERISFGEESELGPIWVEIEGDVDTVIDRVASLL